MADLTNKTLAVLIGLVLVVSLVGTWAVLNKVNVGLAGAFSTNAAGNVTAIIESTASIGIVQTNGVNMSIINFSTVLLGSTYNSITDGMVGQRYFVLENNGSATVNVTQSSTALWVSASALNTNYTLWAADNESNSAVYPYGTGNPQPANSTAQKFITYFNSTDTKDTVNVYSIITVPVDEPAGTKTATVTFTASVA